MITPSIAVVIPAYNRADLIGETLAAIRAQTLAPAEIIVVDDGSTDATPARLAAQGAGIRTIRVANGGDLVARNVGLAAATADLVAFCDSDDLWQPGYLAAMAALWQAAPRLVAACGDFVTVREGQWGSDSKFAAAPAAFWDGMQPLGDGGGVFDRPIAERLVGYQPFFPSALVAARAALLAMGGWDTAVSRIVGTDFATALRIAAHAPIGVLRRPLVGISKHAGNFSADVQAMNLGDSLILEHALRTNAYLASHAALVRASVVARRHAALDTAFARMPGPVARGLSRVLLTAGSLRGGR